MRRGSLLRKLVLLTFVPTAVILVAVALVNLNSYQKVTEDLVIQRNRELARLMASRVTSDMSTFTEQLGELARKLGDAYPNLEKQKDTLVINQGLHYFFDGGLLFLNNMGLITASVPERDELVGVDLSSTELYKGVEFARKLRPNVSDLLTLEGERDNFLALAYPITTPQGSYVGVVIGLFKLQNTSSTAFYNAIARLRFESRGVAYLVDGSGRVLYHTDINKIGEDYSDRAVVRSVVAGKVGALRTRDEDNEVIVASYAPVLDTRWGLVIQERWNLLLGSSRDYRIFLLTLLAFGVMVPAFLVTIGVRRITEPIIELTRAAQDVAGGNFGQTIVARTGDEVEDLTEQFNRMSIQLQESYTNLERRVEARTHELSTLNSISQVVTSTINLSEIIDKALGKMIQALDMDSGAVYLLDNDGNFSRRTQQGLSAEFINRISQLPPHVGAIGEAARKGLPIIRYPIDYLEDDLRNALIREGLQIVVCIPLLSKGRMLGAMNLCKHTPRTLSEDEISLLSSVGNTIGVAVENAHLYIEVQQRMNETEALFSVQQAITSRLDQDAVLQMVADEALRLTGTEISYLYLLNGDKLVTKVLSGMGNPGFLGTQIPLEGSVAGLTLKTGLSYLIEDAENDPRVYQPVIRSAGINSFIMVPLISDKGPLGALTVANKSSTKLIPEHERVLVMLASIAVIAIENARFYQKEYERRKEADKRRRVAENLRDILATLNSNLPLQDTLNYITAQSTHLLGSCASLLYRYDHDGKYAWIEARHGYPEELSDIDGEPLSSVLASGYMLARQPFVYDIPEDIDAYIQNQPCLSPESIRMAKVVSRLYRTYLAVPLIIGNEIYGALCLYYSDQYELTDDDIGIAVSFTDQAALAVANALLRQKLEKTAVAAERNRLARELHDAVTQTLFSASLIAEVLPRLWNRNPEEGQRRLEELRQLTRGALAEMRALLLELRPSALVEADMSELFRHLIEAFTGRTRVPVQFVIEGKCDLSPDVKVGLYRITQEAFNNIAKHANANQVRFRVNAQLDRVTMEICDDGCGFSQDQISPDHLGVGIMKERAENIGADLCIESQVGNGTRISLVWPAGLGN
jgi:nitrate/nitrite-specific signal transduction histidine kinase